MLPQRAPAGETSQLFQILTFRPLLQYICEFQAGRPGSKWLPHDGDSAARNGHVSLMQERLSLGTPFTFTAAAIDTAAANDDIEVVRWLHAHSSAQCTAAAVNAAAVRGHLAMLEELNRMAAPATTWAMDGSAAAGRLDVVQWLGAHRSEGCTHRALNSAAVQGRLDILQYLLELCSTINGCTVGPTEWALHGASMRGHVHVLAYLTERLPQLQCTTDAIDLAAIAGQLAAVVWLNEHRSEGHTLWGVTSAKEQGFADVVAYLESDCARAHRVGSGAAIATAASSSSGCGYYSDEEDDDYDDILELTEEAAIELQSCAAADAC